MKRNLGAWSICMRLLSGSVVAAGARAGSTELPEYSGTADTARSGHFCLPAAGIPLSGIYRRALLVVAAILAAIVGYASPVLATTTVSSNWIQNLSLDADPERLYLHDMPKIAVSGPYVHAVWRALKRDWSGCMLYYRRSTDGGNTFEAPQLLAQDSSSDFFKVEFDPRFNNLVADGAYVHIFYTVGWPRKLNYIRSADNGGTFVPAVTLSSGDYGYDVYATASNGNVAVGWTHNSNTVLGNFSGLYSSHSSDGGAIFSTTTVVVNDNIYSHSIVDAARSGNNVYFLTVIRDSNGIDSQKHLYLWASTDGGATFKPPQKVNVKASNDGYNDGYYATYIQDANYSPNLAASGDEVNVVWINVDNAGEFDGWAALTLRTRRSTDAGTTLGDPVTLHTFPAGYQHGAHAGLETIARIGNRVHAVTVKGDDPAGTFLWTSNDGGASWGTEKRISAGGWWPQIQLDAARVHIANSSYFRSADAGVTFDSGVNPHASFGTWSSPRLVLGADGAAHYIGSSGSGPNSDDAQIMYRRIASEPAAGTTDKVLLMTTVNSSRVENLQIAATPDINFSSAMTVESWVRQISGEGDGYSLENLISKSRLSGRYGSYEIGYRSDWGIYSHIVTTQTDNYWGARLDAGVSLPLGTWTHVAMTYDANGGADNWKIYVNGNLAGKATIQGTIVTDTLDSPLRINSGSSPYSSPYSGQVEIDELRLWNKARTEAEIQADMDRPLAGTETGLTAYYNFNDTFRDITGRGNDAVPMYLEAFVDSSISPREKTLSVTTSGNGTVSVNTGTLTWNGSTGTASYTHGASVTLTAAPGSDSSFYGWSGACTGTGSCTVTMNWEKAVTANFVLRGDINNDGSVTLMDAILALQVVSGVTPATSLSKWGDVDGDGKIGFAEVIYILQKVAGMRLTIPAATLVSIGVTPATAGIPVGGTQQFIATGTYSDATTQDLTSSVTWSSSNATVATISNAAGFKGVATSLAAGITTITATSGLISGNTTLTATAATLMSIGITPATAGIPVGGTQQFIATGTYSDATTHDLTSSVIWTSSNSAVAAISNAAGFKGVATSLAAGINTITATSGLISGNSTLMVTMSTLVSIAVTPATAGIPVGGTQQFIATGTYSDATTHDLTSSVIWTSSNSTVAAISNAAGSKGLATSLAIGGPITITATDPATGRAGIATLTTTVL